MDKLIPEYHLPFSKNCELADGTTATVYDANGEAGKNIFIVRKHTHGASYERFEMSIWNKVH